MKGFIIGKEVREYQSKDTQEKKVSRTLHVVWNGRPEDGLEGKRVESVYCGFPIDDIAVGMYCEFEYDIRQTRSGSMARLMDVIPIGEAEVLLAPPEVVHE